MVSIEFREFVFVAEFDEVFLFFNRVTDIFEGGHFFPPVSKR